jgi:hypothetical protein
VPYCSSCFLGNVTHSDVKLTPMRLRPQALVPFWDIKAAPKEIERAHGLGLWGVTATSAPEAWGNGLPD